MPALGVILLALALCYADVTQGGGDGGFVETKGVGFVFQGEPFFANGFNAYWLMSIASTTQASIVSTTFATAAQHNLKVVRTWAFNDGTYRPLQISPGSYDQQVFQGLDLVVSEAGKSGIKLILSLVNNYKDYGGKSKYVEWGRAAGQNLQSDDDFFTNSLVKQFYKNHVKTLLLRRNTLTGVLYRDDPTIMAWELMNEPRIDSSSSSSSSYTQHTIHFWIQEMAGYVKSIDYNHLVEAGLEGFYGYNKLGNNPNSMLVGTDFIADNQLSDIDFCTVHSYPEIWLPGTDMKTQMGFLRRWVEEHIEDAEMVIKKPVVFAEFGRRLDWSDVVSERDELYGLVYTEIRDSYTNRNGGAAAGALFWQVVDLNLQSFNDDYGLSLTQHSSTLDIIDSFSRSI